MYAKLVRYLIGIALLFFAVPRLSAQEVVQGVVLDGANGSPIAGALIAEVGGGKWVTDEKGRFAIQLDGDRILVVSSLGYELKQVDANKSPLTIRLTRKHTVLQTVEVVQRRKGRYRRKGNPAVELIRKVMAAKEQNRVSDPTALPPLTKYQKRTLYGTEVPRYSPLRKGSVRSLMRNFDFSVFSDDPVFPISLREQLYSLDPGEEPRLVDSRFDGFEEAFEDGTSEVFLNQVLQESDVYNNTIGILLNQFVSPTDPLFAIANYHYYLGDTIAIGGYKCATLTFTPSTEKSRGFTGKLFISLADYAVVRSEIEIEPTQNVNFLDRLRLIHQYQQLPSGAWLKSQEDIYGTFKFNNFFTKVYLHQTIAYSPRLEEGTQLLLSTSRPVELSVAEQYFPDHLKVTKQRIGFKIFEGTMQLLTTGMLPVWKDATGHERLEVGSIRNFIGSNPIEGRRLRLSASTTAYLHPQLFLEGYAAYGFRDKVWKYSATGRYSFTPKEHYPMEYPRHDITLTSEYDLFPLGVSPGEKDNLITMIGTSGLTTRSYQQRLQFTYTLERESGWSYSGWWRYLKDTPAGSLSYQQMHQEGWLETLPNLTTTLIGGEVAYSPGITGYKTRTGRKSALQRTNNHITISLRHEYAYPSAWLKSSHTFQQTTLALFQRTQLSLLGEVDWRLEMGKVWGKVPFPYLSAPKTSPIKIEKNSFHLLRPFEFVTDQHIALHATYNMRGLIFNHIPLLRHLELREMVSLHALYGWLGEQNNPLITSDGLFPFPNEIKPLNHTPYVEMSVGISNVLQLFRFDYFFRLTHRKEPNALQRGLRFGVAFAF